MSRVYLMRMENGPCKIGMSSDPVRRLRDFSGHPFKISLVSTYDVGDRARHVERLAHSHLRACRLNGEWFDATDEDAVDAILTAIDGEPVAREPAPLQIRNSLSAAEFRVQRAVLGWTKKRLGETLNRTAETIRKYEREGVDGAEAIALQALASGWRP